MTDAFFDQRAFEDHLEVVEQDDEEWQQHLEDENCYWEQYMNYLEKENQLTKVLQDLKKANKEDREKKRGKKDKETKNKEKIKECQIVAAERQLRYSRWSKATMQKQQRHEKLEMLKLDEHIKLLSKKKDKAYKEFLNLNKEIKRLDNNVKKDEEDLQKKLKEQEGDQVLHHYYYLCGCFIILMMSLVLALGVSLPYRNPMSNPLRDEIFTSDTNVDPHDELEVCHKITKSDRNELNLIIAGHGSPKQWCFFLPIKDETCNQLDYTRQHRSDVILDIVQAFLDQTLNPCWEEIVDILCNSFNKVDAASQISEKHSVRQCNVR